MSLHPRPLPAALLIGLLMLGACGGRSDDGAGPPPADVVAVITERCAPCHSATPEQPGIGAPPRGVAFDTPDQMETWAPRIAPAVRSRFMPLGNATAMTDDERDLVVAWAEARE